MTQYAFGVFLSSQLSADHEECGLYNDETGELLLPPSLGKQEQGVPALLSQPRLQTLREGQDDAAAQAHVPLQENRKLGQSVCRTGLYKSLLCKERRKMSIKKITIMTHDNCICTNQSQTVSYFCR